MLTALLLIFLPILAHGNGHRKINPEQCEPIRNPSCQQLPYSSTIIPINLGYSTLEDASLSLSQMSSVIKSGCHPEARFFFCSVYSPACSVLVKPIPPCREFCLDIQKDCSSVLSLFNRRWPGEINCTHFPKAKEAACIQPEEKLESEYVCPFGMKSTSKSHYIPLRSETLHKCGLKCNPDVEDAVLLDANERSVLLNWTAFWSTISFVCCVFTILTFITNLERFKYPVRPIMYLTFCYLMISTVYIIGTFFPTYLSCGDDNLVMQGSVDLPCVLLGSIEYYFQLSSAIWWMILCLCWYLSINHCWVCEAVSPLAPYFHLSAWGIPLGVTILASSVGAIDGDILTGTCSIGNLNPKNLLFFVVIPTAVCLLIGVGLLAWGLYSSVVLKDDLRRRNQDIGRMDKLIIKVFVFSLLYLIPIASAIIFLTLYALNLPDWLESWYSKKCQFSASFPYGSRCPEDRHSQPTLSFFMFKYFSQLLSGIVCLFWVANLKTIHRYFNGEENFEEESDI